MSTSTGPGLPERRLGHLSRTEKTSRRTAAGRKAIKERRILRDLGESANRDLVNAVSGLYPRKLILPLLEEAGLDPRKKANEVTRAERARLLEITKALPFTVTGARPLAEAIVTRGGAELSEVDPRTMESRIVPGLYFAGEILDADAETGGFNLQIAWATGRLAGLSAAR